jgi:hypothetical protein
MVEGIQGRRWAYVYRRWPGPDEPLHSVVVVLFFCFGFGFGYLFCNYYLLAVVVL